VKAGRREWVGLGVLAIPTLLVTMDLSVLFLAVPKLTRDLHPSSSELLWITDIYGLMIAACLITMGTVGDRIGRRRLLLIGGGMFALASLLAAFSTSPAMLIAARGLLGVAGATLAPSALALIRNMFDDPDQRQLAIAIWISCFAAGAAIGPLLGGALLQHFWWGSVFLVNVPLMAVLLAAGPWLLPESRDPNPGTIDLQSIVLSLASLLATVYGITEWPNAAPTQPRSPWSSSAWWSAPCSCAVSGASTTRWSTSACSDGRTSPAHSSRCSCPSSSSPAPICSSLSTSSSSTASVRSSAASGCCQASSA
jgi:MFS transporter, DHA2 family, multidrug resistance protein